MHHLSSYLIAGLLGALAVDSISGGVAMPRWGLASDAAPTSSAAAVNRDLKGNRLLPTASVEQPAYRNVRIAGQVDNIAGPADQMRSILFNATPMTHPASQSFGTWHVGLGTAAPSRPAMRPDPANRPIPTRSTPPRLPDACDPAFSPIAAPALAHIIGRCLT
jgi:hypothetical protein